MNDWVWAETVYNGQLIAGGKFTSAAGVPCNYIAAWNGSTWSPLCSGMDNEVDALCVYNGQLWAGGRFLAAVGVPVSYITYWDGSAWNDPEGGADSYVVSLTAYGGKLIAGGYFTNMNGPANYIAQWDGNSWSPMGSGMGGSQGQVMALSVEGRASAGSALSGMKISASGPSKGTAGGIILPPPSVEPHLAPGFEGWWSRVLAVPVLDLAPVPVLAAIRSGDRRGGAGVGVAGRVAPLVDALARLAPRLVERFAVAIGEAAGAGARHEAGGARIGLAGQPVLHEGPPLSHAVSQTQHRAVAVGETAGAQRERARIRIARGAIAQVRAAGRLAGALIEQLALALVGQAAGSHRHRIGRDLQRDETQQRNRHQKRERDTPAIDRPHGGTLLPLAGQIET